jgi:Ca-activated chloride channel homolog
MSRRHLQSLISCLASLLVILGTLAAPAAALADGIVIIDPPPCPVPLIPPCDDCPPDCPTPQPVGDQLDIKYHRVRVTIENQVATTHVEQVFHNPNNWEAQGIYVFPIPTDAAVNDFAMWVNGQRIEAQVLDADQARQMYDDIVRRRRDPALLEYIGRGAVQASLFPIPPGGDRKIELEYTQVLTVDNGLVHYVYPMNTEKFSAQPLEEVSVSVRVVSADPVRAIYSPSHDIAVDRQDDYRFTAGYEDANVTPDTDFELYYSVAQDTIGLNLLTYRDPGDGDGFFLLLAAPGFHVDAEQRVAKDVVVVLDQSGSMEGEKFAQAQDALRYVLDHLNPEDRFNIIAFSTGTREYARGLRPASEAAKAGRWVDGLAAGGGTDINLALLEAMDVADAERPTIVIFLTDGLATEGVIDTGEILQNVERAAPANVRLFTFGVGDDVDTILLDTLAEQGHGASAYVRPGERIDEAVSGFYAKVQTPVLSNIALDFGGMQVEDVYPSPLPDLFAGSQLVLAGRYRQGGGGTITLSGQVNGRPLSFDYPDQTFRASGGADFVPRLWATRKIGYLLNQIRLHGEQKEWVDEIVTLSVRYGIVTPYTSYLITEDDILTAAGRGEAAQSQFDAFQLAPAPASGGGAVTAAEEQGALQRADLAAAPEAEAQNVVKIVGNRTFLLIDGVWTDTGFDPSRMAATPVQFASDDYFALLNARPDLAVAFALGPQVIALADGEAYQVVPDEAAPIVLPPPATPEPEPTRAVAQAATPLPASTPVEASPTQVAPVVPESNDPGPFPGGIYYLVGAIAIAVGLLGAGWAWQRNRKFKG